MQLQRWAYFCWRKNYTDYNTLIGMVIKMKNREDLEEKVAYRLHVVNDQGGGGPYCSDCNFWLGSDPGKSFDKCPACDCKVIDEGVYPNRIDVKENATYTNVKDKNKKMSITQLVETIEANRGSEIRMHPYGFLQLSLGEGAWRDSGDRLHAWSDELPQMKRPEFQVHDHIYGVRSRILLGALRDTQYIVEENVQGKYLLFSARGGNLLNTKLKVSCTKRRVSYFEAGEQYSVVKGDYHSSESLAPLTATLFQKMDADLDMSPSVIGPAYYEKMELLSDDRTFDQHLAWRVMDKALEEIKKRYLLF